MPTFLVQYFFLRRRKLYHGLLPVASNPDLTLPHIQSPTRLEATPRQRKSWLKPVRPMIGKPFLGLLGRSMNLNSTLVKGCCNNSGPYLPFCNNLCMIPEENSARCLLVGPTSDHQHRWTILCLKCAQIAVLTIPTMPKPAPIVRHPSMGCWVIKPFLEVGIG